MMIGRMKRYIIVFLLLAVGLDTWAQQEPAFTHYWMLPTAYNPAAAGKTEELNIVLAYNMQLTGFERAPKTMFANADLQLALGNTRHGVGGHFMRDDIGLFSHARFVAQYNYKFPLLGGVMAIGAQVDMLNEKFVGSNVDTEDASDPAIPRSDVNGSAFDFSAGLYYAHRQWYVGLSALHLTAPVITLGETYQYPVKRTYFFTGGYNIRLRNPFVTIQPTAFGMYDGSDWLANVGARVTYTHDKRHLFAGVHYGINRSVGAYVGGTIMGAVITYSYEAYTTGVGLGHGAHEIAIGYKVDLNLGKKSKNKHKSVRLL